MMTDQLKKVLSNTTPSVIVPQLSRKTVLLKKKNQKLTNNTVNSIPSKNNVQSPRYSHKQSINEKTEVSSIKSNSQAPSLNQAQYFAQELFDGVEIPHNDPVWLEIIPQELLQETTVERLLEDNKEYLYNLLGLYLQERAIADLNMSRFVMPQKFLTQYNKDFTLKSIDRNIGIDSRIYEDFKKCSSQNQNTTTYRQFYQKPIQNDVIQSFRPQLERNTLQMAGLTTYKANHIDFKQPEKPEIMKAPTTSTTGHLQLSAVSNYNKDYKIHQNIERIPNFKNSYSKLNPISNSDLFFTRQRESFDHLPVYPQLKSTTFQQTPSFKGQFMTTFKHDFQSIDQDLLTPKMKNWRVNIINKINSVREKQVCQ